MVRPRTKVLINNFQLECATHKNLYPTAILNINQICVSNISLEYQSIFNGKSARNLYLLSILFLNVRTVLPTCSKLENIPCLCPPIYVTVKQTRRNFNSSVSIFLWFIFFFSYADVLNLTQNYEALFYYSYRWGRGFCQWHALKK